MSNTNTAAREAQLARIRALMAKTVDNGCTEAEANGAAAAVDRLLAAYEINMDEVTARQQEIVRIRIPIKKHDVRFAGARIAAFCDCKIWTSSADGSGDLSVLGFKVDTEIAEYLVQVFRRAIDREADQFTMFNQDYELMNRAGRVDMLRSFRVGMASRLGDRLHDLKSKRDFTQRTSGTDLVAIKMPMVMEAWEALGIRLSNGSAGKTLRNAAAYSAGQSAADSVPLSTGIAGRGQMGGRLR